MPLLISGHPKRGTHISPRTSVHRRWRWNCSPGRDDGQDASSVRDQPGRDPRGSSSTTQFTSSGELECQIDRRGWCIGFEYDDVHCVTRENRRPNIDAPDPGDLDHDRVTTYDYNAARLLASAVDPDSALAVDYSPNELVQWVDDEGTPDAPQVRMTYGYWGGSNLKSDHDANGNVTQVMDERDDRPTPVPQGMTEDQYDELDRLGRVLSYSVDGKVAEKRVDVSYYASGRHLRAVALPQLRSSRPTR